MTRAFAMILAATSLLSGPALAQDGQATAANSSERRLTPGQIEAVLAEAAKKREAAEVGLDANPLPAAPPQIQGEVGVAVGSDGYREVFGTGVYPLGDDGAAAVSFDFMNFGKRRDRR